MEEIDLKELLLVYWKKKWFVAIVTLISLAIGYAYSYYHTVPKYEATPPVPVQIHSPRIWSRPVAHLV